MHLAPSPSRRHSRPTAPSCRGGVSSLLRLAQPAARIADVAGRMTRRAAALVSATVPAASIITPLAPSRPAASR